MATEAMGAAAGRSSGPYVGTPEYDRILADRRRRSQAGRLGWIRRKRRDEIQKAIAEGLDELRDRGHGIALFWPTGKPMDRPTIARFLYWMLVQNGAVQAEQAIGYEALDDGR